MKKVLWFSRHPLQKERLDELDRIYGGVDVIQVKRRILHASEIAEEVRCVDVVAIVAPLTLQREFLVVANGKPVIVYKTGERLDDNSNNKIEYSGWYRLKEIKSIYEKL